MNRTLILRILAGTTCILLALSAIAAADDSAASIAAGSLIPRRETRVVMAKEVLRISPKKIIVDYDFRNDSDQEVTTEVAFPIPLYTEGPNESPASMTSFSDFEVQVNGSRIPVKSEAKAFLNGKEITSILNADNIDVASFGHHDWNTNRIPDLARLSNTEQKQLEKLGIFLTDPPMGAWNVKLQYHWTQTFPAHSTVHIRHEYTPYEGFEMMPWDTIRRALREPPPNKQVEWDMASANDVKLLVSFCPDPSLLHAIDRSIAAGPVEDGSYARAHWVDFVLTSANTWQQPIEDFTLIVERGVAFADQDKSLVSFCSPKNAAVEKLDAYHFAVHLVNFVPRSELRIGFIDVGTMGRKTASEASKK